MHTKQASDLNSGLIVLLLSLLLPKIQSLRRAAFSPPALHLAVVVFLRYFSFVPSRRVAVRVHSYFPFGSAFSPGMAGVLDQIIIIILIVVLLFERG